MEEEEKVSERQLDFGQTVLRRPDIHALGKIRQGKKRGASNVRVLSRRTEGL